MRLVVPSDICHFFKQCTSTQGSVLHLILRSPRCAGKFVKQSSQSGTRKCQFTSSPLDGGHPPIKINRYSVDSLNAGGCLNPALCLARRLARRQCACQQKGCAIDPATNCPNSSSALVVARPSGIDRLSTSGRLEVDVSNRGSLQGGKECSKEVTLRDAEKKEEIGKNGRKRQEGTTDMYKNQFHAATKVRAALHLRSLLDSTREGTLRRMSRDQCGYCTSKSAVPDDPSRRANPNARDFV